MSNVDLRYKRSATGAGGTNPADPNAAYLKVDGTINDNSDFIRRNLDFSDSANWDSIVSGSFGLAANFANISDNEGSPSLFVPFIKNEITLADIGSTVVAAEIGVLDDTTVFSSSPENWLKIAYSRNGASTGNINIGHEFVGSTVDDGAYGDAFSYLQSGYGAIGYAFTDYIEMYEDTVETFSGGNIAITPTTTIDLNGLAAYGSDPTTDPAWGTLGGREVPDIAFLAAEIAEVQSTQAYTTSNVTITRSIDADTITLPQLADVVGSLIQDFQNTTKPMLQ